MLTGRRPFEADELPGAAPAHHRGAPPAAAGVHPRRGAHRRRRLPRQGSRRPLRERRRAARGDRARARRAPRLELVTVGLLRRDGPGAHRPRLPARAPPARGPPASGWRSPSSPSRWPSASPPWRPGSARARATRPPRPSALRRPRTRRQRRPARRRAATLLRTRRARGDPPGPAWDQGRDGVLRPVRTREPTRLRRRPRWLARGPVGPAASRDASRSNDGAGGSRRGPGTLGSPRCSMRRFSVLPLSGASSSSAEEDRCAMVTTVA